VDLIVMGGEARGGWRRRGRSPVAHTVIRRTSVPTLVVASDAAEMPTAFRSVLVAVDLSPASKDVLAGAIGLTADAAVRLTVLHTIKRVAAGDAVRNRSRWVMPAYLNHVLGDARRKLEAVVSDAPASVETRVQVSTGSAARTILANAAEMDADLVVVGRSGGFKILGSTAQRVLRTNDRALLVIPTVAHRRVEQQRAA
jgi:nucleotide-binding universal stress UspA family protein